MPSVSCIVAGPGPGTGDRRRPIRQEAPGGSTASSPCNHDGLMCDREGRQGLPRQERTVGRRNHRQGHLGPLGCPGEKQRWPPFSHSELKHLAAADALHAHHGARRGLAGQSVAARTTDRDPHFAAQSRACRSARHQRHMPLFTESPVSPACPHGFPGLPVQARQPSHRQRSGRIRVPVGKERPHRPERPIRISRNAISPAGPPTSRTARSPSFVTR